MPQKLCLLNNKKTNKKDVKQGCTGDLRAGQLIVKEWEDPFLHGLCAQRLWREKVGVTDSLCFRVSASKHAGHYG